MGTWQMPTPEPDGAATGAETFVWPPKPVSPQAATRSAPSSLPGHGPYPEDPNEEQQHSAKSEPRDPNPPRTAAEYLQVLRGSPRWWTQIERVWLDPLAAPLAERVALESWVPDGPGAYCPRCGVSVAARHWSRKGCEDCMSARLPWERVVRIGEYAGATKRWVREVKFTRSRRLGLDLGRVLGQAVREQLLHEFGTMPRCVLVPVPSTIWRRLSRGIDHTQVLAIGAASVLNAPIVQPLRRKHRPSQTTLPPSRRPANVKGAFGVRFRVLDCASEVVILIDDVTTTGSTMRAAARAARAWTRTSTYSERKANPGEPGERRKLPVIWAAMVAHTPKEGHDAPDVDDES